MMSFQWRHQYYFTPKLH